MSLVIGEVRFSYVSAFEPRVTPNGDEKYSVTLLIPKTNTEAYQTIMNEIQKCLQENIATTFKGVAPANSRLPIYDGDGVRESGEPFGEECKGHWVISAKSNTAPEVVDANLNPIISKSEFYSGCYGRASIRFYAYNQNGNKGIGCGLGNLQKLRDGQPLDGRTSAKEDFGAFTPAPQPQTPQYQQPMQPIAPNYQIDPITGQPVASQPMNTLNNIYGVN